MINLQRNFSLKQYNTFGIDVKAEMFVSIHSVIELKEVLTQANTTNLLVLSGGSNILFTKDVDGLVVQPLLKKIEKINEDKDFVYLKVGAGVEWDSFVGYCVMEAYGGIENLSLIPGWVGACPIQNIGAYGVEVRDVIYKVDFFHLEKLAPVELDNASCNFGYRDSIFKNELRNKGIITHVYFRLNKKLRYVLNYGNLEKQVQELGQVNLQNIRKAVISIRQSKLPDTNELGNAGSFFKNPEIAPEKYEVMKKNYPSIPGYSLLTGKVKIPAAWLIEAAGYKGKRIGNCGTHVNQPLVIVNYGKANGNEIVEFSESIKRAVKIKFDIVLQTEVNIW